MTKIVFLFSFFSQPQPFTQLILLLKFQVLLRVTNKLRSPQIVRNLTHCSLTFKSFLSFLMCICIYKHFLKRENTCFMPDYFIHSGCISLSISTYLSCPQPFSFVCNSNAHRRQRLIYQLHWRRQSHNLVTREVNVGARCSVTGHLLQGGKQCRDSSFQKRKSGNFYSLLSFWSFLTQLSPPLLYLLLHLYKHRDRH